MCLLKCVGRLLLVALNLTFLILSMALISGGVILLSFFERVLGEYVNPTWDEIRTDINALHGSSQVENKDYLEELYYYFAIIMIVTGIILFFMSLFGFIGSCCEVKKLLHIYSLLVGISVIVQVIIVALFIWKEDVMLGGLKGPLEDSIKKYQGTNGTNGETWAWNFLMRKYGCCGIEDYKDFQEKSTGWWEKDSHLTPYFCCKDFPTSSAEGDSCAGSSNTASLADIDGENYYNTGCLDKAWDSIIVANEGYVIIALFAFFCLQILVIVFACILSRSDDDNDRSRVHPKRHVRKPKRTRKAAVAPKRTTDDYW